MGGRMGTGSIHLTLRREKNVDVYDESEIDPATPFGKATLH